MAKDPTPESDPATLESVNEQAPPPNESSTAMAPGTSVEDALEDPTTPSAVNEQGAAISSPTPDESEGGPAPTPTGMTTASAGAATGAETGGDVDRRPYEDRTVEELRELASSRGLPVSGTKDELIDRLRG
ncbi:MAG TPA: SAP domain-containing protein [Actinomycetota bacterium]|nr:SAP domain-containing protein [Actinomycetota bacterium]